MSKPLSVGVTGGIGAGKTLVTKLFSILNVPIYYADDRAKELMDNQLVKQIASTFGTESYVDGKLNRTFIATKVFSNKEELDKLNEIVHPAVALDFEQWILGNPNAKYVIKEAALLVETGSYTQLDKLVVVIAPRQLRVNRIKLRDPFRNEKEIEGIISHQTSDDNKIKLADFIITNDEKNLLIPQVIEIDKQLARIIH